MIYSHALLAETYFLVSIWKPIVLLLPFVGWMYLVSKVFDKHCARFFLPRVPWNIVHMCCGMVALGVALFMPLTGELAFWASFLASTVILGLNIVVFASIVNKDDRVPEQHRLRIDFSKWNEAREAKALAKKQGKVELVIKSPDKSVLAVPQAETPEFQTRVAAEEIVVTAFDNRSAQLEVGPSGKDQSFRVWSLIDGQRTEQKTLAPAEALAVMNFWKAAGKLDVAEARRKQTADVNVERGADKKKLRITSIGTQAGPKLTLLIEPEAQVRRKDEELGLLESQAAELKILTSTNQGVVLVAGIADGGRTTLLYSLVKMHDAYTQNVQTVEIEPQDLLEGVKQNKWDPQQVDGPDFGTLVRTILRRDPQVVAVAEVPEGNTAKEIAKADSERVRIYASLMANGAVDAVIRWVKAVGDQELASKVLRGVVAVRLVRRTCTNCRVPYQPPPDMLKKLGLSPDKVKQLVKKGGQVLIKNKPEICPVCQGTGYLGQEGCFEVYSLDDACKEAVRTGNLNALRNEFRKKNLPTIQQAALAKAVALTTTVDEVIRISAADAGQAGPTAPKPAAPTQAAPAAPKA